MKKLFFLLAAVMLVFSCAKDSLPPPAVSDEPATHQEETVFYETAAYQEATGDWLFPSHDPYDLAMVQQAYNNLTKGRTVIPYRDTLEATLPTGQSIIQSGILPEVAKEFEQPARKGFKLKPTHRVLKTWPHTREQAESLEADERLDVRTYPTNYTPISAQEAKKLTKTRMASAKKLPKETKYKYTDPGGQSTEGIIPPSEVELPVFYIVWPVEVQVPADLDHEVLYDIFLPYKSTLDLSEKALQALDFETNALARRADKGLELEAQIVGGQEVPDDLPTYYLVQGTVLYNLSSKTGDVPIAGIQVNFVKGGNTVFTTYTDASGRFSSHPYYPPSDAAMSLYFLDSRGKFKLTMDNNFTSIHFHSLGQVGQNYAANRFVLHPRNSNFPFFETWIAAKRNALDEYFKSYKQ